MPATFSFSRLGKLIAKQFFENSRLYLFSFLALFGLLGLASAFWGLTSYGRWAESATYIMFFYGLFISGTIFSSMTFGMLGNKPKGIYWLSVPATHLEKLLCGIFYSTIFFTALYCVCFFLVKTITIAIVKQYVSTHTGSSYIEMTDFDSGFGANFKYFIYGFIAVQALYLLGSVYFNRYSFILTSIVAAAFTFVFVYYMVSLSNNMFDYARWNLWYMDKFDSGLKDGYYSYSLPPAAANILKYGLHFIWAPVFWVVTWFRLKEKEI